ncbi:MAG: hypothetical protein AAB739_02290 [Patescibacteria group bacterium]
MNCASRTALEGLESLSMPGGRLSDEKLRYIRDETDRRIAALELGLPPDTGWGRISRIAEADSVASPKNYR